MERESILLRGIEKGMLGVEIGPYFAPLVPKRAGYRSLALDVFDRERLVENAKAVPNLSAGQIASIETVDLLGSATSIGALVEARGLAGQVDYIVTSHNFEHLPNPIEFLLGCQRALQPDGFVSMAVPDRRGTFDYFRPVSTTADFLAAYHEGRSRPTAAQIFALVSAGAQRINNGKAESSWDFSDGGGEAIMNADLSRAYAQYRSTLADPSPDYSDNHCSVFTRSSFELILRELHFLGVIDLGIDWLEGPDGCEFYARLRRNLPRPGAEAFNATREDLLRQIVEENARNTRLEHRLLDVEKRLRQRDARIAEVEASWSWKITAPFRDLKRRLRAG